MCGIAGILSPKPLTHADVATLDAMVRAVRHRGPDAKGSYCATKDGVLLGHRRLAIVDLSDRGAQPMQSSDGRFVINFNGEIYNHRSLRRRLGRHEPVHWCGDSDTEVLLAAIQQLGLDTTLNEIEGMFAFCLYDRRLREVHLVRDRFGEKPLYVANVDSDRIIFGSELSSLERYPKFRRAIDYDSLAHYFRFGYIPAPQSIYRRAFKLRPGHRLSFKLSELARLAGDEAMLASMRRYWPSEQYNKDAATALDGLSPPELTDTVERALRDSVALRLSADVSVGIFQSAGVDSTTVTALAADVTEKPLSTFSLGIDDPNIPPHADAGDETARAAKIAAHLGTRHHEFRATPPMAAEAANAMARVYDEPFADPSQLLTTMLAGFARTEVKVCLAGDGADELFGGYNRHVWIHGNWAWLRGLPAGARQLGASAIRRFDKNAVAGAYAGVHRLLPRRMRMTDPCEKLNKIAAALEGDNLWGVYQQLATRTHEPVIRASSHGQSHPLRVRADGAGVLRPERVATDCSPAARFMAWDIEGYLAGNILTKLDRASMYQGLEMRLPYLDRSVFNIAQRLPIATKIDRRQGKRVLREIATRRIPERLIAGPKTGFSVPLDLWLRTSLRDFGEEQLAPARLGACDYLDGDRVRRLWREHQTCEHNHALPLWHVLMFLAWNSRSASN